MSVYSCIILCPSKTLLFECVAILCFPVLSHFVCVM
jgi:hypothetical protein